VRADGTYIEDLGSKNGTYVNDARVKRPRRLSDGDEIRIGSARMVMRLFSPPPSTTTATGGPASGE
jgi:pSer/pThr/pTyr-binding forkhead associated (FHA) protein